MWGLCVLLSKGKLCGLQLPSREGTKSAACGPVCCEAPTHPPPPPPPPPKKPEEARNVAAHVPLCEGPRKNGKNAPGLSSPMEGGQLAACAASFPMEGENTWPALLLGKPTIPRPAVPLRGGLIEERKKKSAACVFFFPVLFPFLGLNALHKPGGKSWKQKGS